MITILKKTQFDIPLEKFNFSIQEFLYKAYIMTNESCPTISFQCFFIII